MQSDHGSLLAKSGTSLRTIIKRYDRQYRRDLWKLTSYSPGYKDLLVCCPAAAVAMVTRQLGAPGVDDAMGLVHRGGRLDEISQALQIPLWYRRLPPEAFRQPPARLLEGRGTDAEFGKRILNLRPTGLAHMASWLEAVTSARLSASDDFAIWLAEQMRAARGVGRRLPIVPLLLYGAFSCRTELEAGQRVETPWQAKMGIGAAARESRHWLQGILQDLCSNELPVTQSNERHWTIGGFDIEILDDPVAILDEARAMQNCLAQYVRLVGWGRCRLYGLRRDSVRIATFEVRPGDREGGPFIRQICGPKNAEPPFEAVAAANAWMHLRRPHLERDFMLEFGALAEEELARLVWRPFAAAIRYDGNDCSGLWPASIASLSRDVDCLGAFVK